MSLIVLIFKIIGLIHSDQMEILRMGFFVVFELTGTFSKSEESKYHRTSEKYSDMR